MRVPGRFLAAVAAPFAVVSADGLDGLRAWQKNSTYGLLNRVDDGALSPLRRVILIVGATGAGKSSTANTLAGRQHARFDTSAGLASRTRAPSHRDYEFLNQSWRVIDTPGLGDTNRAAADVMAELRSVSALAPHGLSAVIFSMPHGRYSVAQDAALKDVMAALGGLTRVADHAILGVTGAVTAVAEGRALMTRAALLDEIACLPLGSFLRAFVEVTRARVVAVENKTEPHKWSSRMALHQRVIDIEDAVGGARLDISAVSADVAVRPGAGAASDAAPLDQIAQVPCVSARVRRGGKTFLVVECEIPGA